jgi:hypothetical protein
MGTHKEIKRERERIEKRDGNTQSDRRGREREKKRDGSTQKD